MCKQRMESKDRIEKQGRLVRLCIEAASQSIDAVESWRRQRRTLERMPAHLAAALLHRLIRRRLLFPSLLEVFKYSVEEVDLRGESSVDAEWMAYLGAFHYLTSLNIADCRKITNSALWAITGMTNLKEIDLSRCSKVNDAGIMHLLSVSTLEKLHISQTGVTAKGISLLSSLKNLSVLELGGLRVTDQALYSLQVLTKLQHLDLWGSEISNEGAALLTVFPKLSILNLAWTNVTDLPNLPRLTCLNMSNCSIRSIFRGNGDKAPITNLILSGATYADVLEAFSNVETSFLSYLDISNSSFSSFSFFSCMNALESLDLSSSSVDDKSMELITSIGEKLRNLNLSGTQITSAGVGILAGKVPNLLNISLSCTRTDDLAISYISTMPSLKVINLSKTVVKGLINGGVNEPDWIPSLTALQNLIYLESLDLEDTQLGDEALHPLSGLQHLGYLSLKSNFLTDMSLHLLSPIRRLTYLGVCDAILTNAGLDSFNPPATLRTLDFRGCWLLTKDALLSFCKKYPQVEVRHEFVPSSQSDQKWSRTSLPSTGTSKSLQLLKKKGEKVPMSAASSDRKSYLDQRLKYSREELLALQFSSLSYESPIGKGNVLPW
ncbi:hypothetical protein NMG60_11026956 [Bertholletia excelsa]